MSYDDNNHVKFLDIYKINCDNKMYLYLRRNPNVSNMNHKNSALYQQPIITHNINSS